MIKVFSSVNVVFNPDLPISAVIVDAFPTIRFPRSSTNIPSMIICPPLTILPSKPSPRTLIFSKEEDPKTAKVALVLLPRYSPIS